MTCLPRLPVCRQTLLATAVALLLTACGGGGGSDTAPSSGAQGARPGGQNGLQPAVNPLRPGTGDASATPAGSTDASGHQADVWARYDNGEALSGFGTGDRGAGASGLLASDESPDGNPSDQSGTLRRDAAASMGAGSSVAASLTSNNPAGNDRSDVQKAVSSGGIAYPDWTLGSRREASRFLAQASFGPSPSDITTLTGSTANAWIEQQFGKGGTSLVNIMNTWQARRGNDRKLQDTHDAWWYATTQHDQLRQRIAYSLSQIFVVSSSGDASHYPKGVASYYDMLARNAFGNFRQLLQDVTLHPMMGVYLTHIGNQKERYNSAGELTQAPDENYAREVMQLFTIGLEQLNTDGTVKKDGNGRPIPTYGNDDVMGLARVFTGLSWSGNARSHGCFFRTSACLDALKDAEMRPMVTYDQYHSTLEKRFLGKTIAAGSSSTMGDITVALDTLFNHPNVGPFFGRQMIQRLVTSNPSPAYVKRVASAFNDNGNGVRGDMKAVIRAVLLDPEARNTTARQQAGWGRIREPLLRFTHLMRAFNATSLTGNWPLGITEVPGNLNQTAMRSPSVFNFYRPGFTPAGTPIARAGLVAPEMQILHESSVAGYADYLDRFIGATSPCLVGLGNMIADPGNTQCGEKKREIRLDIDSLLNKAGDIDALIDEIDVLMLSGQMQTNTRQTIRNALNTIQYNYRRTDENTRNIHRRRTSLALYMALLSTDYLVLK